MSILFSENYTIEDYFQAVKAEVQSLYSNRNSLDYTDWIYGCEPETMVFVKDILGVLPGNYSLYNVFCLILNCGNYEGLLKNSEENPYKKTKYKNQ